MDLFDVAHTIGQIVLQITPIIATFALLGFFWGLAKLVFSKADEQKKEGRSIMVWGITALFFLVTIWGVINLLAGSFKIGVGGTINEPHIPTPH